MNKSLLLAIFASVATCAVASPREQGTEAGIIRTISSIEQAYARRHVVLDANGHQPSSASAVNQLFPAFGFAPPGWHASWSMSSLDADRTALCVAVPAQNLTHWHSALRALTKKQLHPVDENCAPSSVHSLPTSFPALIRGRKLLDRRDYPVRTLTPAYPLLSGINASAVTTPAATLAASPGQWSNALTISIHNPPVEVEPGPPPSYQITGVSYASSRAGFNVQHACESIPAGESCDVTVRYFGEIPGSHKVFNLRLEFSTGQFAVISLLGVTNAP